MGILDVSLLYRSRDRGKYGWGKVLDYIGVEWENLPEEDQIPGQMELGDFIN